MLFANETLTVEGPSFLAKLGEGVGVSLIFILVAAIAFPFIWKLIDKITPGDLDKELLGDNAQKQPNVALAIVVGAMVLAFGLIIAAAIH